MTLIFPRLAGTRCFRGLPAIALAFSLATPLSGQERRLPPSVVIDILRARDLYVSNRWEDHPDTNYERDIERKRITDSIYAAVTEGVVDYRKTTYRSLIGDLDIPAYLFQPLEKRDSRGHAAMVWAHSGVHSNWGAHMWPFVREAVERGYVIIVPEYRGSTGYGEAFYKEIDYGGYEVDDVITAYDWMVENLPHVDPERVGIMGWSHGGLITILAITRDDHPFKAGVANVPVTNLIFRLSWSGPGYQRIHATQRRVEGLPFEKRDIYLERSPYYQVDDLETPLQVDLATNDDDVYFVEASQLVYKLRDLHPTITDTKIYVDPPGGHSFSRQVNRETLEREDTPEQIDVWNRTWAFFDWYLRPYQTEPTPVTHRRR